MLKIVSLSLEKLNTSL